MKPNRKLFFAIYTVWFAFGCIATRDSAGGSRDDLTFGLGILVSSFVFLAIGLFIIYGDKKRDAFFGIDACPSCGTYSINIKDKIKSAPEEMYSHSFCTACNSKLKLHFSLYFLMLVGGFFPLSMLLFFDSVAAMFVVLCASMPIVLWVYSRHIPLVKA